MTDSDQPWAKLKSENSARLKETVTALERLRIGLLRLHGGLADLRPVTTALYAARAIDRDLNRLVEGQAEVSGVRRVLSFERRWSELIAKLPSIDNRTQGRSFGTVRSRTRHEEWPWTGAAMERATEGSVWVSGFSICVAFALAGCGDRSLSGPSVGPSVSIVISPGSATIGINGAVGFVAVGFEAGGRVVALDALQWSSLDPSIVTVDADRVASGLLPGTGRIVAHNDLAADTVSVVVANILDLSGRNAIRGFAVDPHAINQSGLIVGHTFPVRPLGPGKPFAMSPDLRLHELPLPGGSVTGDAQDVSEAGVIVGISGSDFLDGRSLVWSPAGETTWTVAELPWSDGQSSFAHAISPNGNFVAGQLFIELTPNNYGAFPGLWVRTAEGNWTLERLPVSEGLGGFATDVNDFGDVVGGMSWAGIEQAAVWRRQAGVWVMEELGIPGGASTSAYGINSAGVVVGQWEGKAVTWVRAGVTWDQRHIVLPQDGVDRSYASGINDAGVVVGAYVIGGSTHAFRWKEGKPVQRLQALSANAGARAINSRGQVVGTSFESNGATFLGTLWPDWEALSNTPPLSAETRIPPEVRTIKRPVFK